MIGISIKPGIGIGDGLQFSSLPENYFKATGEKLIDISKPWFFDHNPYVSRETSLKPTRTQELWNFSPHQYEWPKIKDRKEQVYLSNAEIWAEVMGVPVSLNRHRLYKHEDYSYQRRRLILLHTDGRSHGKMPQHVIDHVIKKYRPCGELYHIGQDPQDYGIGKIKTVTLWGLADLIASCRMLICMDSGPAWIGACYPDVVVKKLRTKPTPEHFKTWVPLSYNNLHSFWDDRCHQVFNPTNEDIGFTSSYRNM